MARDLSFWRVSVKTEYDNRTIYAALSSEEHLSFIEELPTSEIQRDFNKTFEDWKNYDNSNYEKASETFQLMITNQFVRADCYGMTERSMNNIIDIMLKYNCPLYDSSIDVRFDDEQD